MPKQKTNRAAAKRFKISGTGRAIRGHSSLRHGMIRVSPYVYNDENDISRLLSVIESRQF